mgnify:CR=1 FL=1
MSKISHDAARAFEYRKPFKRGNTEVRVVEFQQPCRHEEVQLLLHGNIIAWDGDFGRFVTCAGWPTQTTKSRLNALLGVEIKTVNGQLMLNSHPWDGGQSPV